MSDGANRTMADEATGNIVDLILKSTVFPIVNCTCPSTIKLNMVEGGEV